MTMKGAFLKSVARSILAVSIVCVPLILPMKMARGIPEYVFSGAMFHHKFNAQYDIGALDEPGLQDHYFLFTVFAAVLWPALALARWISDRRSRVGYWSLVVCACITAWTLIMILLPGFYLMIQYIVSMGVTPKRVQGILYAVGGLLACLLMVVWVAWPPKIPR